MKKINFDQKNGVRKYILRTSIPHPINVVETDEDGNAKLATGEWLSAPSWNQKGDVFAEEINGQWYAITEDIGTMSDHDGPWDLDPWYYENGYVVVLEDTPDEEDYLFDGWCNLYPRGDGKKAPLSKDCHPSVAKLFC